MSKEVKNVIAFIKSIMPEVFYTFRWLLILSGIAITFSPLIWHKFVFFSTNTVIGTGITINGFIVWIIETVLFNWDYKIDAINASLEKQLNDPDAENSTSIIPRS